MKFQIKIILAATLIMIVVLFYLNTMVVNFVDYMKEDMLYQANEKDKLLNKAYVEQKFQEYIWNVLLWECLLVLSLMLILYKIIDKMTRQEREYRDFLELILLTISHKFGNFLAVQKGNIEILKLKNDQKALERLEMSYNYLKEDFHSILDYINRFKKISYSKEKINLRGIIEKNLMLINPQYETYFNKRDVYVYANRQILENIIFTIIENAFKYSDEKVRIKLAPNYLAVRNKILSTEGGTGVGLKIAETLAKKQGFKLLSRGRGNYFIALLKFR